MGVVKQVHTRVEFTTDTPEQHGGSSPTWTEIPVIKIHGDTDARSSEAQTVQTFNGLQGQAAELIDAAYIVAVDDTDQWHEDLRQAAEDWTPVWFRETPQGNNPRLIGGETGGIVTFGRERRQFGDVEVIAIGLTASGANPDDVFDIEEGGS